MTNAHPPPPAGRLLRPRGSGPRRGLICYDLQCPLCCRLVARTHQALRPLGFSYAPLQSAWVQQRLGIQGVASEMKLLLPDGSIRGGADAVVGILEVVGWARPLAYASRLPGIHQSLDAAYRFVAAHRGCRHGACRVAPGHAS